LSNTGNIVNALYAHAGGIIYFNNVNFGIFSGTDSNHIFADGNSSIYSMTGAAYTISGGATGRHIGANESGYVNIGGATVTVTGTPAIGTFASALGCGNIYAIGAAFTGSATGVYYSATLNAVIQTGGGGATFFPGNSAGSTASGGVYA
jgi:hypothetical protein